MINLFDVQRQSARLRESIDKRLAAVLDHGQFVLGPEVSELETRLAEYVGCGDVVTVSSGRDALVIALLAEGIGAGDVVFVPAFTFSATAEAVTACGATPVFVDIDSRTFNLDVDDLERAIRASQRGNRPRAIIAVDLFGLPADYDRLNRVAEAHDLFLIADSAQSFGAELDGRKTGSLAPVTAISFYPTKPLGAFGDGGALLTDDPERAARYRSMRINGRGASGLQESEIGMTARLDTIQAAILLSKLDVFDEELTRRRAIAEQYSDALGNAVIAPYIPDRFESAHALYSIRCDRRDDLWDHMKSAGINCGVYYSTPLHLHPALRKYGNGEGQMPISEEVSKSILSIPMHPDLTDAEIAAVCEAIASFGQGKPEARVSAPEHAALI